MFIDASALCAILEKRPDAAALCSKIERSGRRMTSATAIRETAVAVSRILDLSIAEAETAVRSILLILRIETLPIPPEAAALSIEAYERFGKGRHPAALNFGDCFADACARHYGVPLLYKGDDFPRTDIEAA